MTPRSGVITDKTKLLKSALGHFRPKWPARVMSAFPPIATIQRTSGEVRFVLFRKWERHYSIASAARTELPRVRLTPRGCLLTLSRQRSGSLFRAFAQYWPPVPPRGHCERRMEVFVS